jgi:phosphatidylserine decarboxylase
VGRAADVRLPRPVLDAVVAAYVRLYDVDLSEVDPDAPPWTTLNGFFTRPLRPGARPVDPTPAILVSPADAHVQAAGAVPADGRLQQIKGRSYGLAELLGDPAAAELFAGGSFATLYLSPRDYHRVHSPVAGAITRWSQLPGRRYPVNALSVKHIEGLYAVNQRVVVHIAGERPEDAVAVVLVGATNVGRISLTFDPRVALVDSPRRDVAVTPPRPIARGAELGAFNLGSTVVVLAARPLALAPDLAVGAATRVGQPLLAARPTSVNPRD